MNIKLFDYNLAAAISNMNEQELIGRRQQIARELQDAEPGEAAKLKAELAKIDAALEGAK